MRNTLNLNREEFIDSLYDEFITKNNSEDWDPTQELIDRISKIENKGFEFLIIMIH